MDGPDLVRRAVDQAERLRLYAAAEAKMHDNAVLLLKPYDELVDVTTFTTSKKGRKKLSRWVEDRMLPLVVPFYPDYVDMIFGGPLKMHAILAVDPADPPAPPGPRRVLPRGAAASGQGHAHRHLQRARRRSASTRRSARGKGTRRDEFLKVTKFPTYLISDMTEADDEHPGGAQTHFRGDLEDKDEVLAFQNHSPRRHWRGATA